MVTVSSYSSQSAFPPSSSQMAVLSDKPAGVTDEEWLSKHFPPVAPNVVPAPTPSPALAEQMTLGARAFAEFNDTLARLMDYGLIATWGERNALREEELGLPLSGWTGKEVTSPTASAAPQAQVAPQALAADGTPGSSATTAIASSVDTEPPQSVPVSPVEPAAPLTASPSISSAAGSVAGVSPLTVEPMTVASEEATESTSPTGNQAPELPVSPSVTLQAESGRSATSDAPVAKTSSTNEGAVPTNSASTPGPLPSLSSLTAASSHSSSSWIAPNSWYVSDELYAVRQAATEQYRQMNLGTLQKTLFDEA